MPVILWPHQEQAVRAAVAEIGTGGRCQAILACGTGKTLIGAAVSAALARAGRVLVVVPTLELLAQTASSYAAFPGGGAGMIGAVCSDAASTVEAGEIRAEMGALSASVSTDPAQVARWLAGPGRVTVLTTYQSLPAIAAAHAAGAPAWDLVVVDEAHRSAGRTDRAWHVIHEDAAIPAARRLYMTATPRIIASERHESASMDDLAVFGREAFRLSFADAIDAGLLADYRLAVTVITDRQVAGLTSPAAARIVSAGGPAVPAAMLAGQVSLLRACAEWDLRRVITYHHRVSGAHRFAATLANAASLLPEGEKPPHVRAAAVDGTMSLAARREELRHLRAPGGAAVVVSNARVLAEGVDVPELDGVMFADPRESATDVVQAVGRALRRGTGEAKIATILVPVLLGDGETPEAALEGSEWDKVWRVVRALRAHDERLADYLDERRAQYTRGSVPATRGYLADPPRWLTFRGAPVGPDFARAVHVRLITAASSPWAEGIGRARAYHAEHGHLRMLTRHVTEDGYRLGDWIATARTRRAAGQLPEARVAQLDALGMTWTVHGQAWEQGFAAASAYAREHGHLDVPQAHATSGGYRLGAWISNQRQIARRGTMIAARRARLDALGMTWDHDPDVQWRRGIGALREFAAEHGHCRVPKGCRVAGVSLPDWLADRRADYRAGQLDPARVAQLEALGVSWHPHGDAFRDGVTALAAFTAEHGHCQVPRGTLTAGGTDLLTWVTNRRSDYRAGTLPPGRAAELEAAGIIWDPHVQDWRDGLADCQDWHAAHGTLDIGGRARGTRITALGRWVSRRRREYRDGTLPADRIAALTALGMQWDTPGAVLRPDGPASGLTAPQLAATGSRGPASRG